jgi:hypothetical protein
MLSEFEAPSDVDAVLDDYSQVADVVRGKIAAARGVPEINAALSTIIAGIWLKLEDRHAQSRV